LAAERAYRLIADHLGMPAERGRAVAHAALFYFAFVVGVTAVKSVSNAMYLSHRDPRTLPYLYLATAATIALVTVMVGRRLAGTSSARPVLRRALVVCGALLAVLAAVSVLYGAIVTIRQTDMKRLVAFSSVSHMGFVMLGISAIAANSVDGKAGGLNGAALQMFTHGTITGLAFLMVGLTYDRAHTRHIPHLGGLWRKMPLIAIFFLIAGFGLLGLPGLSGFVSEIMTFLGTYPVWPWATAFAAFGVVLAAGYVLWMVQRAFFGPKPAQGGLPDDQYERLTDASWVDMAPAVALAASIFVVGVWPKVLTDVFDTGVRSLIR
jgi:NADH:ubiquinone oxidoreductase subunit 4 (subunit M)